MAAKRRTLQKELVVLFSIAMVILGTIAVVISMSLNELITDVRQVRDSYQVMVTIGNLNAAIRGLEAKQRGYLLTGEQDYIDYYNRHLRSLDDALTNLQQQTDQMPRQAHTDLVRLENLIRTRTEEIQRVQKLRQNQGMQAAIDEVTRIPDFEEMLAIQETVDRMAVIQQAYVNNNIQSREANTSRVFLFLMGGLTAVLGLLILAFYLINREIKARQSAEEQTGFLNKQLESQVLVLEAEILERLQAENQVKDLNQALSSKVDAVNAMNHKLSSLNAELEAFSYSVSHDLRSPLRSLDGYSQALIEDYGDELDTVAQGYLDRIRKNSQRMGQLIDDLLMLSRLTRKEMSRTDLDLSGLARDVVENLREQEPDRRVDIRIQPGMQAKADKDLMKVALENLLGNAWKFTQDRDPAVIELGQLDGDTPTFYIRDNGAGFDMKYVGKLFGAFQRLHGAVEFPGTGIGLATVQRVVHRHGGHVWAEGKPDEGATFYFTLPDVTLASELDLPESGNDSQHQHGEFANV